MDSLTLRVLRHRRVQVGLALVVLFGLLGALAPLIAPYPNPYDPNQQYLAAPDALPGWVRYFPGFSDLNPNIILPSTTQLQAFKSPQALDYWSTRLDPPSSSKVAFNIQYAPTTGPVGLAPQAQGPYVLINTGAGSELINITGVADRPVYIILKHNFQYGYSPPPMFYCQLAVKPVVGAGVGVAVFLFVNTSRGIYYTALGADQAGQAALESLPKYGSTFTSYFASTLAAPMVDNTWNLVSGVTTAANDMPLVFFNSSVQPSSAAQTIFSSRGNYSVGELIEVFPPATGGPIHALIYQSDMKFMVFGRVYGLLGTDWYGASVWSEFVYGARIAYIVGFGASLLALGIGVVLGMIAGLAGGIVDSFLIFVFDFFLLFPALPFLVDLDVIFTESGKIVNKVLLIIIILGVLSWSYIARVVRSQVMSIKQRGYVEASRVLGAGNLYIIRRHVFKHLLGVVAALTTFTVPAMVLADAALDFLSLGVSNQPTWGNLLAFAFNYMTPANGYLSWIILPVGFAIIAMSLGFFFVGSSIQEELGRIG